jgi:hypothetical protein
MPNPFNSGYTEAPPWVAPMESAEAPQSYIGPFSSRQEQMLTQSLQALLMTSEEVQEFVRPPLPQVEMFPQRYGYPVGQPNIRDIIEFGHRTYERTDYAQQPNTQESTSRNSLGRDV